MDEVNRRNIASLFLPIDPVNPCLVLHVSRTNLVQDTIEQLTKQAVMDLKKPLKVAAALVNCLVFSMCCAYYRIGGSVAYCVVIF